MGALTDWIDREITKCSWRVAEAIWRNEIDEIETFGDYVTEEEIKQYLTECPDGFMQREADIIAPLAYHILQQFLGQKEPPKYFFLAKWHFVNETYAPARIIRQCEKWGLEYKWRISKDDDFFMFRPEKHGMGLEIKNNPMLPPYRLTQIFQWIKTDAGPIVFRW